MLLDTIQNNDIAAACALTFISTVKLRSTHVVKIGDAKNGSMLMPVCLLSVTCL